MLKSYLSKISCLALFVGMSFGVFAQNLVVTSPASIAGSYPARPTQVFGPDFADIVGELVLADDGQSIDVNGDGTNAGTVNDGCEMILNDVNGKIALIDRGECGFVVKAQSAQDAGAIAVIICNNNTAAPNNLQYMGGTDPGTLTIPTAMISYNSCQTIKAELLNGPVMGATAVAAAGESCATAFTAVEGLNNAPVATGGGSLFNTAQSGLFYKFTPTADALMTVASCGATADTYAYILGDGCGVLTNIANNDDCDADNGDYGSTVSIAVTAGVEYVIYWDDVNTFNTGNEAFDWTLTLSALPDVSLTFNVDMTYTAAATDGVKISINGGAEADMTNVGGTIWSYTTTAPAGSTVDYRFVNGAGNPEDDALVGTCRTIDVGLDPIETIAYCFNDCFPCPPPVDCSNPDAIICDNFDNYAAGTTTGSNAAHWSTWSGTIGGPEDGIVSAEQANSAPNSMLVQEGGSQDVLLLLGDRATGVYSLSWKMYIPAGKIGYHNIQNEATPGIQWNHEVYFGQNGANGAATPGTGIENSPNNATFSFPHDSWFDVRYTLDLDNDQAAFFVNGTLITTWVFDGNLGSIDFFSANATTNRFYIDDVIYEQMPSCRNFAVICDNFEMYPVPGFTGANGGDWWSTWSGAEGGAEDGILTNEQASSGLTSMKVGNSGAQDVLLLLGNRADGIYRLSYNMYIPAGSHAYFNVQNEETPGVQWNLDLYFNRGAGTAGGPTPGIGVVEQSGTTFTVIEDQWFEVAMAFDLDNDKMSLFLDGVLLETTAYTGNIGSIDFFSVDANNTYYIDDVEFLQLPSCPVEAIICDGMEFYGPGTTTGGQATWWTTWSGTFGTAEDGIVSNLTASTGANSVFVSNTGTQDVILDLGNRSTGVFDLSFDMYVPAGHVAYYNMQNSLPAGTTWNFNVHFGNDAQGVTAVFGTGIIPEANNAGFSYPEDTWFPILHTFDLENNTYSIWINGVLVVDQAAYAGNLGGIDFFSINGDNTFYVDDVYFVESVPPTPTVDVTFRVDMANVSSVSPAGVRIAGSFNGWTDQVMTNVVDDIWEITVELEAGEVIQYKFKNGPNGWENSLDLQACGIDDGNGAFNRLMTVGDFDVTLPDVCFNSCVECNAGNANESAFSKAVGVNPNPAGTYVNVTYNFENMVNLNVRLVNTLGQTLLERNLDNALNGSERFDIANLPSGAYTVVFSNGAQTVAKRLIVE